MEEQSTWQRIVEELSKEEIIITGCKTREEVCAEVEANLCNRYNTTPDEKIKEMAEAMTGDLMKILNLETKEESEHK